MTTYLKWLGAFVGLASFFTAAAGSQAEGTGSVGTLVFSGGIHGTVKLNPANCVAGPGPTFNLTGASAGGWSLLFLKASDPPGKRGTASVQLEGDGYKSYVGAVTSWGWTAKKSGHNPKPSLEIAANGETGTIQRLLAVESSYNGPRAKPVEVTASWNARTCKTNE